MGIKAPSRHELCEVQLEAMLANGPVDAAVIYATLGADGYSKGTIYRSAVSLGVISTRKNVFPGAYTTWEIKNA